MDTMCGTGGDPVQPQFAMVRFPTDSHRRSSTILYVNVLVSTLPLLNASTSRPSERTHTPSRVCWVDATLMQPSLT